MSFSYILLFYLVDGIIFGFLCLDLNNKKGYEGGFWLGFFFGLIALIYYACLPENKEEKNNQQTEVDTESHQSFIYCKNCGFPIYEDEDKCSNCGNKK